MKFLKILILVLLGFVVESNAQLCGRYMTTLKITDAAGQPVKNSRIQIIPLQEDDYTLGRKFKPETDDPTNFSVFFNEGYFVKGDYKVVVSAPGYLPAEKKIDFPHCAGRVFQVILKPSRTAKNSKSEFLDAIRINGEIYEGNTSVSFVTITATDHNGATKAIIKTEKDPNGRFYLQLPLGTYTLTFQKHGYKTLRIVNIEIKEQKNIYLYNVELERGSKNEIVEKDYKDLYKSRDIY